MSNSWEQVLETLNTSQGNLVRFMLSSYPEDIYKKMDTVFPSELFPWFENDLFQDYLTWILPLMADLVQENGDDIHSARKLLLEQLLPILNDTVGINDISICLSTIAKSGKLSEVFDVLCLGKVMLFLSSLYRNTKYNYYLPDFFWKQFLEDLPQNSENWTILKKLYEDQGEQVPTEFYKSAIQICINASEHTTGELQREILDVFQLIEDYENGCKTMLYSAIIKKLEKLTN